MPGAGYVTIKDASGTERKIRTWESATGNIFTQLAAEAYAAWRLTKVTFAATTTVTLASLLPGAAALAERLKFTLEIDPLGTVGTLAFSHATFTNLTDTKQLALGGFKEFWLPASTDIYVKPSATGLAIFVEEWAGPA